MELYLIRHGECFKSSIEYYNSIKASMDPPLTPTGISQAKALGERLQDKKIDKIYSSDLGRATYTAEIIKGYTGVEVIVDKALQEINMGEVFQKGWGAFPDYFMEWNRHDKDICYPGGENGADVWERCTIAVNRILSLSYERVLIISHGGSIRSLICGMLNIPQEQRFNFSPPENCSISIVKYIDKFYLHTFNDFTHLQ